MTVDKKLKVGDESWVFGKGCIAVEIVSDIVFKCGDVGIAFGRMNGKAFHCNGREGFGYRKVIVVLYWGNNNVLSAMAHDSFGGFANVRGHSS